MGLFTTNDAAFTPPKRTIDTPVKFVPSIETVVPAQPEPGEKEEIVGTTEGQEAAQVVPPAPALPVAVPITPVKLVLDTFIIWVLVSPTHEPVIDLHTLIVAPVGALKANVAGP